ncbi:hypothetical protein, partial [Aeromonas schubertii]|uniref:hypothetical protein n=1 Tax=Aeromonas schubertii TaxID=652 RepID=UPI001F3CEE5F
CCREKNASQGTGIDGEGESARARDQFSSTMPVHVKKMPVLIGINMDTHHCLGLLGVRLYS